jgi:hypothetical protein
MVVEVAMADEKLPAKKDAFPLPETASGHSIVTRITSAFRARLFTRTIVENTRAAEAYRLNLEEQERLVDAILKKEQAVAHYVRHRDKVIQNDHEQHRRQMLKHRIQRQIDAEEDKHQRAMARLRHEEQLLKAKTRVERAQFVHDTFTATAPHRKDSEESRYRKGAANEALDMLAVLQTFLEDEQTADEGSASPRALTLEEQLAYVEKLMDDFAATASPEAIQFLNAKRAQLRSQIEEEKNRPR